MFFSNRNQDTVYTNHFNGLLEVEGIGDLRVEDTKVTPSRGANWAADYDTLYVKEGITALCEGYLEAFPGVTCLILSRTVMSVDLSPELIEAFQEENVLIRGEYETYAEEFADRHHLRFLHCDIPLAEREDRKHHELDMITLRFHPDSVPDIHHNIFLPGNSAGSYGGGEVANPLPEDFYVGCTLDQFARNFPEDVYDQLTENEMLHRFLKAANRRHARQ